MSGCYGNDPYYRWLEKQLDDYWESILENDDEPSEEERRAAAAEAA